MSESRPARPGFAAMNVYEMFVANGEQVGFWLTRTTWRDLCARVRFFGDFKGPAPCFGNPRVAGDLFYASSGELKQANAEIPSPETLQELAPDPGSALVELT